MEKQELEKASNFQNDKAYFYTISLVQEKLLQLLFFYINWDKKVLAGTITGS